MIVLVVVVIVVMLMRRNNGVCQGKRETQKSRDDVCGCLDNGDSSVLSFGNQSVIWH